MPVLTLPDWTEFLTLSLRAIAFAFADDAGLASIDEMARKHGLPQYAVRAARTAVSATIEGQLERPQPIR